MPYRYPAVNAPEALDLSQVDEDLVRLEPLLRRSVTTDDPFLDDVTTHLIGAGGKRIRPMLALASATAGRRSATEDDLLGGVAVELVHLASLYHDDVIDEATVRRNVESVNHRFGNLVAIVAGDYLLARSAEIAAALGTEVARLVATTLALLCQGQVAEVRSAYQTTRTHDQYFEAIQGKTAALMSTSCRIGALIGGSPPAEVQALTDFGQCLGMVFQLADDVRDVVASDEELGKPAGQDLAEGIYTLPVLLALDDPEARPELLELLGRPLDQPARDKARAIVAASPGVEATVRIGRRYVAEAKAAAAGVRTPELAAGLASVAECLLDDLAVPTS
jgi:heptaprenyl diphosphate synthase